MEIIIQTEKGILDVYGNSVINLTMAISDIIDPSKRKSSYSKKYTIPDSPNNRVILGYTDRLEVSNQYKFNKRLPAIISLGGLTILEGHIQVESSIRIDETEDIEFNIVFYSDIVDLFTTFGEDTLQDLYNYDIPMNWEHIRDYSQNDNVNGYFFPGLYYGHSQDHTKKKINDIFPSFNMGKIFNDIIDKYGFEYTYGSGEWIDDLSSLYLASSGKKEKNEEATILYSTNLPTPTPSPVHLYDQYYHAGAVDSVITPDLSYLIGENTVDGLVNGNDLNGYNNVVFSGYKGDTWVCPKTGYYNIDTNFLLSFSYFNINNRRFRWAGDGSIDVNFELRLNGVRIANTVSQSTGNYATFIPSEAMKNCSLSGIQDDIAGISSYSMAKSSVYIEEGDTITTHFGYRAYTSGSNKLTWNGSCGDGVVFDNDMKYMPILYQRSGEEESYITIEYDTPGHIEGETVNVNNFLSKMKIKDFMKGIINLYNLQIYSLDQYSIYIDTYKEFYGSRGILEWTYKVDRSQEMVIEYLPDFTFNKYNFKFKHNKSRRGVNYLEETGVDIGSAEYIIDNDFRNKTLDIEFPFINIGSDIKDGGDYYEDLAMIEDLEYKPSNMVNVIGRKINLESAGEYQPLDNNNNPIGSVISAYTLSNKGEVELTYEDVNGIDNMFNQYYEDYFNDITNINAKRVKAFIYLTPVDISEFDFRKLIIIDNVIFKVSKIINYNPFSEKPTEVELLTVQDKEKLVSENIVPDYTATPLPPVKPKVGGRGLVVGKDVYRGGDKPSITIGDNIRTIGGGLFIGNDITVSSLPNGKDKHIPLIIQGYQIEESKLSNIGYNTVKNNKIIDGGLDVADNILKINNTDILDGGLDEVRNPYGDIRNRIIID